MTCERDDFSWERTGFQPLLRKRGLLILDGILLTAVLLAPLFSKLLFWLPVDCYFQGLGYLCPACGGTRAFALLIQGELLAAFSMNPYFIITGFVLLVGLIFLHLSSFFQKVTFHKVSRGIFHPYSAIVWAFGLLLFGFLRNIMSLRF